LVVAGTEERSRSFERFDVVLISTTTTSIIIIRRRRRRRSNEGVAGDNKSLAPK
jgi:hypothetical protein